MNRDDIIRMAREAGLKAAGDYDFRGSYESMPLFERQELDRVLKFANLVAAAERKACAQICDEVDRRWINQAERCAERIRARDEE